MNDGRTDPRWDRLWELFHECAELSPGERAARLEEGCAGDPKMRAELEELLREHDAPSDGLRISRRAPEGELESGAKVGPYEIEKLVGEGGMGLVYRARQTRPVERTVALKLIRPGMDSREVISRFQLERQSLAMLEHANIARVHDAATTDAGRPYFAMEFVDGIPITTYCLQNKLSVGQRLRLFDAVCRGVQHAHQRGIIHRDLKPTNVLVAEIDGEPVPKIIDFGIARATEQSGADRTFATELGRMIGTPEYMSPEQAGLTDAEIDTRTDVYALGAILYELLTGTQLFDWVKLRESGVDAMRRVIRDEDPIRPSERLLRGAEAADTGLDIRDVCGDLDWIVLKALEKDRERRYDSPRAIAEDLERFLNDHPVIARPPSRTYRFRKFTRRHRVGMVAGAAVALALTAGITVGTIGIVRAIDSGQQAQRDAATAERVVLFMADLFRRAGPSGEDAGSMTMRQALDEGVDLLGETLEDEPFVRARLLRELGEAYRALGVYDRAGVLLDECLELMESSVGPDHFWTAMALGSLGGLQYETGNLAEARVNLERAEDLFLGLGEGEEFDIQRANGVQVRETLGWVYGDLGLHDGERRIAQWILDFYLSKEASDEYVARAYYSLALAMARAGDHDEVEPTLEKSIELFTQLGNQPFVDYALNSLAIHYWNQGDFERSLPLSRRAFESIRRTHGEEHPYTASLMNNVGLLYIELKRYDEARELSEAAYDLRRRVLGADHPDIATSQLNLARLYAETGEPDRAIEYFEEGLEHRARSLGESHASMVAPLRRFASLLAELGRESDSQALIERADAIELVGPQAKQ